MLGEVIGNFKIVKRLGSGGMGEVYLAEHKDLQTPVAVKLLNRDISNNKDHVQRFFNEARVVSKIKSAGTVKIFDSGFHNEQAYLIMELLDGESLATRIERGPLPVQQVFDISRQIASVLDATHRQGVIHRDLKPDNIFVVHDDEAATGERVKILDFGIAKLSGTMAIVSPKTSGTMGTPAYMAPEQWGDSSQIDWRADAYSLGCVMFEMACGRPPFLASNIAEAFVKHATAAPPAASEFVPDVPPALDQLIVRLLAKEPAERAVSMGQVTRELAELAGEPMRERAPSQPSLSKPPIERRDPTPHPSSHPVAAPMPTVTTLGGSASELQPYPGPPPAPRKRPIALLAGIGTVAVAMVVAVIVMAAGKDKRHGVPAASAPAEPASATTAPTATATIPTAPPPAVTPTTAPPPAGSTPAPVVAAPVTPPVVAPATQAVVETPAAVEQPAPHHRQRKVRPGETTTAVTKPSEIKTTVTTTVTTPAETKPVETKPAETKPAEPAGAGSGSGAPTTGRKRFGGGGRL